MGAMCLTVGKGSYKYENREGQKEHISEELEWEVSCEITGLI